MKSAHGIADLQIGTVQNGRESDNRFDGTVDIDVPAWTQMTAPLQSAA